MTTEAFLPLQRDNSTSLSSSCAPSSAAERKIHIQNALQTISEASEYDLAGDYVVAIVLYGKAIDYLEAAEDGECDQKLIKLIQQKKEEYSLRREELKAFFSFHSKSSSSSSSSSYLDSNSKLEVESQYQLDEEEMLNHLLDEPPQSPSPSFSPSPTSSSPSSSRTSPQLIPRTPLQSPSATGYSVPIPGVDQPYSFSLSNSQSSLVSPQSSAPLAAFQAQTQSQQIYSPVQERQLRAPPPLPSVQPDSEPISSVAKEGQDILEIIQGAATSISHAKSLEGYDVSLSLELYHKGLTLLGKAYAMEKDLQIKEAMKVKLHTLLSRAEDLKLSRVGNVSISASTSRAISVVDSLTKAAREMQDKSSVDQAIKLYNAAIQELKAALKNEQVAETRVWLAKRVMALEDNVTGLYKFLKFMRHVLPWPYSLIFNVTEATVKYTELHTKAHQLMEERVGSVANPKPRNDIAYIFGDIPGQPSSSKDKKKKK